MWLRWLRMCQITVFLCVFSGLGKIIAVLKYIGCGLKTSMRSLNNKVPPKVPSPFFSLLHSSDFPYSFVSYLATFNITSGCRSLSLSVWVIIKFKFLPYHFPLIDLCHLTKCSVLNKDITDANETGTKYSTEVLNDNGNRVHMVKCMLCWLSNLLIINSDDSIHSFVSILLFIITGYNK